LLTGSGSACLRAEAAHRRRADHGAGRHDPETDPRADRRPPAPAVDVGHAGDPRPGRDRRPRRASGGHVRGRNRRDDRHRHVVRQPAASLHRGAVPLAAGQGRGAARAAVLDSRGPPGPHQPATGVPVRAGLPVRRGPVREEKPRLLGEMPGHQFACFYPVGATEKTSSAAITAAEPAAAGTPASAAGSLLSIEHLVKDFPVTKGAVL